MSNHSPFPSPPPELVQQWINEENGLTAGHIATQAARWGADMELEACCKWLATLVGYGKSADRLLRAARRPKELSLKERALEALEALPTPAGQVTADRLYTIRLALEQLND